MNIEKISAKYLEITEHRHGGLGLYVYPLHVCFTNTILSLSVSIKCKRLSPIPQLLYNFPKQIFLIHSPLHLQNDHPKILVVERICLYIEHHSVGEYQFCYHHLSIALLGVHWQLCVWGNHSLNLSTSQ